MAIPDWSMQGVEVANCNCEAGCPCQFSRLPTHGHCTATTFVQIDKGHWGDVSLDGLRWGFLGAWPGPIHKGNGTMLVVVDERANATQREAIEMVAHGKATEPGKLVWTVYAAMTSTFLPTVSKPIDLKIDIENREATLRIPGLVEQTVGPLRNAVTGQPHRARINLPNGFEFTEAEVALGTAKTTGEIALDFNGTHAHLARVSWNAQGVVR